MKYATITTDNVCTIHDADRPTLQQMQEAVGGYIEGVTVGLQGDRCRMYVNEEGLLKGLPTNTVGSLMYGGDIRGDIVVFGPLETDFDIEEGPDDGPLDEEHLTTLKKLVTLVAGGEWVE